MEALKKSFGFSSVDEELKIVKAVRSLSLRFTRIHASSLARLHHRSIDLL
jgi:hypothetical protein